MPGWRIARPGHVGPRATDPLVVERIFALRRQRGPAHRPTGRGLASHGFPGAQARRSFPAHRTSRAGHTLERAHPGELIDIKKLGRFDRVGHRITGDRTGQSNARGIGWEFVHVAIDDASRVAFSQILPDEKKQSAVAFLKAAIAYYQSLGITVTRVMTDNGSCYKSKAFAKTCRDLGLKHITRPRPMERPNASSRPPSENGRHRIPNITAARRSVARPCTAIIGIGLTPA